MMGEGKKIDESKSDIDISDEGYFAHPTTVIDEPCQIGKGTRIWHFGHVMEGCRIGERCNIGQSVMIGSGVVIGDGCKIQNNVSVYSGVTLENNVFCGPSMVFTNVINPRADIERKNEFKETLVKEGATIGANATILCGVTVGRYSFIGAGAVVLNDVLDYAMIVGNPGIVKGWMCECGVKLEFVDEKAVCKACGGRFRFHDGVAKKAE